VDIGSQGSCALVVQAVLPVMMRAPSPSTFTIDGGTHVSFAPPYQALHHVILPIIRRFGVVVSCDCAAVSLYRSGPPPSHRGRLILSVSPSTVLTPLRLLELGSIVSVHCWCVSDAACSATAAAAVAACAAAASALFAQAVTKEVIVSDEAAGAAARLSACMGLFAVSSTGCVLGADRMLLDMTPNGVQGGARKTDGLQPAQEMVEEVFACARVGACVDHHVCDQLPLFMSLAAGPSCVRVQPLSDHARSACSVASQFTGAVFQAEEGGNGSVILRCTPALNAAELHTSKSHGSVAPQEALACEPVVSVTTDAAAGALDGCRFFVGNLAWSTTDQDLRQHMETAGIVLSAHVAVNVSNGRSKGYGIVEMSSQQDALTVIQALNNSELKGRRIQVRKNV
jgi:RNA 3'-terminal phosphate cyclase (ATP)